MAAEFYGNPELVVAGKKIVLNALKLSPESQSVLAPPGFLYLGPTLVKIQLADLSLSDAGESFLMQEGRLHVSKAEMN